jgi:hypothetical protein
MGFTTTPDSRRIYGGINMGWISWGNWNDWGEWSNVPMYLDTIVINTTYGDCIDVYAAIEVKVFEGVWHPDTREWWYGCKLKSLGKVQLKPEMDPEIVMNWGSYYSTINLEKVESGDPAFRFTRDLTAHNFGSFPHDGNQPDYTPVYDVLSILVTAALSKMNPYIAFGMTAYQIIDALRGEPDDSTAVDERQTAEYIYPEYPFNGAFSPESSCWYCWAIAAKSNDYVRFTLDYEFDAYEFLNPPNPGQLVYVGNLSTWTIATPPPGEEMTSEEKEKYGLVEIPVNEIDKRSREFRLPSELINDCKKSGKPLYVITNPGVKAESSYYTGKREFSINKEKELGNA